jgi:hypothetical protein
MLASLAIKRPGMVGTRILGFLGGFLLVATPLWGQVHPSGRESSSDIPVATPSHWPYYPPEGWPARKPGDMEFVPAGGLVPRRELAQVPNVGDILLSNRFSVTDTPSSAGSVTDSPGMPMTTLPAGSYPSPYYSDAAGCCGPLGKHGRVGYELYSYTGPNLPVGSGDFIGRLNVGWVVGGGGRALFFNPTHDAAWVIDLGLSYTYNRGEQQEPVFLDIRQPPRSDPLTGRVIPQPDLYTLSAIRGLHRTNFNFALGRDWWLWGPASNGLQDGWNLRVGGQVGGRWGTAHVDIVPLNQINGYARRQNVTHGLYLAAHTSLEVPFGGCILFTGLRAEWGYDWTNIVPPLGGDLKNVNLLLTAGIRY